MEFYEAPLSGVVDQNFDWDYASALLLGYDMGRACNARTIERLLPIVAQFNDPYSREIGKLISRPFSEEQEEADRRRVSSSFSWLMKGIQITRT